MQRCVLRELKSWKIPKIKQKQSQRSKLKKTTRKYKLFKRRSVILPCIFVLSCYWALLSLSCVQYLWLCLGLNQVSMSSGLMLHLQKSLWILVSNDWQSCSSVLKDILFSIIRQSCSLRNRYICMEQEVVNLSVQKIFFIQKLRFPCYQGRGSQDSYQDQWSSVVVI